MTSRGINFCDEFFTSHLNTINNISFTPREIDIIACIVNSRGTSKIAFLLNISPKTVTTHISNIMLKLGCNSREKIIDFVEHSDKQYLLREYYEGLVAKSDFENFLKEISRKNLNNVHDKILLCRVDFNLKNVLIQHLKDHLFLANINCEIKECTNTIAIDNIKEKNKLLILLINRDLDIDESSISNEYIAINYINNYYDYLCEIIKKIYPGLNLDNIRKNNILFTSEKKGVFPKSDTLKGDKKNIYYFLKKNRGYFLSIFFVSIFVISLCFLIFNFSFKNKSQFDSKKETNLVRSDLLVPHVTLILNRSNMIKSIQDKLKNQEGIRTVSLVGMGGAGKTTLARQYARTQNTKNIWEINAETKKSLNSSFDKLAYALSTSEVDRAILKGLQSIQNLEERREKVLWFVKERIKQRSNWLLIYDNVERFTDILDCFPNDINTWGKGDVILTTRDSNALSINHDHNSIHIGELSAKEKLDLFTKILGSPVKQKMTTSQIKNTREFLEKIPPYPLDISIAAYYIKATNTSYNTYLNYLKDYKNDFDNIQKDILREISDYTRTRYSIILLSLKVIISKNKDFIELLLLISSLNSQDIPRELLNQYKNSCVVDSFIYHLKKYSLITNESSSLRHKFPTISLHRNTQEIILSYVVEDLKVYNNNYYISNIINTLKKYTDNIIFIEDFSKIGLLASHYESLAAHESLFTQEMKNLANCDLGRIYFYLGNYEKAKNVLNETLKNLRMKNRESSFVFAQTLSYLGFVSREIGEYDAGRAFLEKGISIYKKNHFENSIEMARALSYLGLTFKSLGHYIKAQNLLESSIKIYKQYFPQNYIGIARALSHLGINYREMGEFEKAKIMLEESLSLCKKGTYENHAFIARTLTYLGIVYRELGYYEKARDFLNIGTEIYKKYFTKDYSNIAFNLTYLGNIYRELGDYQKAKKILEECISIYNNHLPLNLIDRSLAIIYLGKVYRELGNYQKAKNYFEDGLETNIKYYTENHLDVAWILILLGNIHKQLGNYEEAKTILEKALKINLSLLPEDHIDVAFNLAVLGDIYGSIGFYKEAEEAFLKAYKKYKSHFAFNKNHIKMGWMFFYLGNFYKNAKKYNDALNAFEKCFSIYTSFFGKHHLETARVLRNFGEIYLQLGNLEKAETLIRQSLSTFQQHKHLEKFICLQDLAKVNQKKTEKLEPQKDKSQYDRLIAESISFLNESLKIAQDNFPEDSINIKQIQTSLKELKRNK